MFEAFRSIAPMVANAFRTGRVFRPQCRMTPALVDVLCEYDVKIPTQEGFHLTANVFRSKAAAAKGLPMSVVMCAHPYDNHKIAKLKGTPFGGAPQQYRIVPQYDRPAFSDITSWESPDPNFWVPNGYAVVNLNMPGFANSEGPASIFSNHQAKCYYEAIEWVAEQPWNDGAVGLNGVSYLAISQYHVAACRHYGGAPKALKAICPWEGLSDVYRDVVRPGGIADDGFGHFWWNTEVKPTLNVPVAELYETEGSQVTEWPDARPFFDDYWREKCPDLENITVPMLVCASFSDHGLHTVGSFRAFMRAASEHKWVYTHRNGKWDAFYSRDVQELTKRFFDRFVKGVNNGFEDTAPVRLEVRRSFDGIHEVRDEHEWPLARTDYRKLYLSAAGLTEEAPTAAKHTYSAKTGQLTFTHVFAEDTELTGHMALRAWVEARDANDLTLFLKVDKLDLAGTPVPFYGCVGHRKDGVTRGYLAVSRRQLDDASTPWWPVLAHRTDEPLQPGKIVPVDIALWPSSTFFAAGESLRLTVASRAIADHIPFRKRALGQGTCVLHSGGERASYLLIPRIPRP